MPQTIRKYWGKKRGRVSLNFNWDVIEKDSVVLVSASEYDKRRVRFIGAASITVSNIAPHGPPFDSNKGVTFVVNVDWDSAINIVTDITVLDALPVEVQYYYPPTPRNIGLRMQYQESGSWCWIAAGTSVNAFYNPGTTWTQCKVMTDIGQKINGFPTNTSACPSQQTIALNPPLKAALANPYSPAALSILDNPTFGVDRRYLKTGGVTDALKTTGNNKGWQGASVSLSKIAGEISAGRPVIAGITWFSKQSHYVAIAGVLGDSLLILDPANGQAVVRFQDFPVGYLSGATLDGFAFTKP